MNKLISNIKKSGLKIFSFALFLLLLNSCYSFTGTSLSPDVKTIQIRDFINNATLMNPSLAQQFTIDINNRFLQRTTLKGTTDSPNILIEGEITNYEILATTISSPVTTQTGMQMQAAQNRLVITVKVHYENNVEPEKGFDRTYSDEAAFSSDLDYNQIEASQVQVVTERIINKIFNDIVADW